MSTTWVRLLFAVTGVYDFGVGLAFLGFGPQIFQAMDVPPPNHWGYVYFACLLLMTFGVMFFVVAFEPTANRNLIPYGMLLKFSYVAVVLYYWVTEGVPMMFKPFAVVDAVMLALFIVAYRGLAAASFPRRP
jgi:hypothetical protein